MRVTVDDNGPGLPVGMETRVFEKFTRGEKESAKPGVGLGLAICRAIVEAHGGSVGALNRMATGSGGSGGSAEAAEGRIDGARFWFTLPVETPPDAPDPMDEEADDDLGHNPGQTDSTPADLDSHSDPHLDQLAKPTHE